MRTSSSRLLAALAAATLGSRLLAVLPPGATEAPPGPDTSSAFPKRVVARGPAFGVWEQALTYPLFGRTGFYAVTSVSGSNGSSLGGLLEFDAAGNTVQRVSPVQLGTSLTPGPAGRFFAQQELTGATDVTFGLYNFPSGSAVFQNRLTADPAKTVIAPSAGLSRTYVVQDLNTQIDVLAFNNDNGSLLWGRRLASSAFGITGPSSDLNSQTAFVLPLADGSALLQVTRLTTSFGLPGGTPGLPFGYETALVKLSASGNVEWAKKPSANLSFTVIPSADGSHLYAAGANLLGFDGSGSSTQTFAKLSTASGATVWSRQITGPTLALNTEFAGGRLLLTGFRSSLSVPLGNSLLVVLGTNGAVEASTEFAFDVRNFTIAITEDSRVWLATTSGPNITAENPGTADGPVYIGLTNAALSPITWKRYVNDASFAVATPDYDGPSVAASFFRRSANAMEVLAFQDDFAGSVDAALLAPATATTTTNPGITSSDTAFTLTDLAVTSTSVSPAVTNGSLTFESMPVTETALGASGPVNNVSISAQPQAQSVTHGAAAAFSVTISNPGGVPVGYQWLRNGLPIPGANAATLVIGSTQSSDAGAYSVVVTANGTSITSSTALLSITIPGRVAGQATEVGSDIRHPNGNTYDQFLMTGTSASFRADAGQITRISFVDLNDDIVQVEFSGAGTLSLSLSDTSGPATPAKYNQPSVQYMRGRPSVTFVGADDTSNLSIFSVGRINAVNQALFRDDVTYDGRADVAVVNISSANGLFAGFRAGNCFFSGASGDTGLNAPGVNVTGPVILHDIEASGSATPRLLTGTVGSGEILVTGGNLLQPNNKAILFGLAATVRMAAGSDSHGTALPAQANQGKLERNGIDVTASVIVGP